MLIFSYIVNFVGLFAFIASLLVKGKKMGLILFLNFCGNALIGAAYLMGGKGVNGAISSFLGAVQAIVNYLFTSRGKSLPRWLIAVYALAFVGVNLWVGKASWLSVIAIGACLCCVVSLVQNSGKKYRFWALCNNGVWCTYDICLRAYGSLLIHFALFCVTATGMILHDWKKKGEEK